MSALLTVTDLHVSYGAGEIVRGVSLSLREGEVCALLGLNGSGKTTFLRAVCGLLPSRGECFVRDQSLIGLHERARARLLSYIPQASSDIHGKTVMEVVLMGFNPHLGLLASTGPAHRQAALAALEKFHLADRSDRPFSQLSQGQKQLVILSRALVQNAPVMLMDEPDSALDFLNRHRVLSHIRNTIHEERCAGLITLHDPNFAMAYCDRLLLLRDGLVAAEVSMGTASPGEIHEKLSLVYGSIELLQGSSGYLMGKGQ